jgi:hypothetical protein
MTPPIHNIRIRQRARQGSALIAVFWMIAVLGMVVFAGAKALKVDTSDGRLNRNRVYARRMAETGIEIGRHPAIQLGDPLLRHDNGGGMGYDVHIVAEEARLNINVLLGRNDTLLLQRVFRAWGVTPEVTSALVDGLKDWVDADDRTSLNGAEQRDYERLGFDGMPFNRPFSRVEDMLLVRGMELIERHRPDWRDWFTVFGDGLIDVNDARPELISLLAEVPMERVAPLLALRAGPDRVRYTQDDVRLTSVEQFAQTLGIYQPMVIERLNGWIQFSGPIRRIESTGFMGDVRRRLVLITQSDAALWRGEIPHHGPQT